MERNPSVQSDSSVITSGSIALPSFILVPGEESEFGIDSLLDRIRANESLKGQGHSHSPPVASASTSALNPLSKSVSGSSDTTQKQYSGASGTEEGDKLLLEPFVSGRTLPLSQSERDSADSAGGSASSTLRKSTSSSSSATSAPSFHLLGPGASTASHTLASGSHQSRSKRLSSVVTASLRPKTADPASSSSTSTTATSTFLSSSTSSAARFGNGILGGSGGGVPGNSSATLVEPIGRVSADSFVSGNTVKTSSSGSSSGQTRFLSATTPIKSQSSQGRLLSTPPTSSSSTPLSSPRSGPMHQSRSYAGSAHSGQEGGVVSARMGGSYSGGGGASKASQMLGMADPYTAGNSNAGVGFSYGTSRSPDPYLHPSSAPSTALPSKAATPPSPAHGSRSYTLKKARSLFSSSKSNKSDKSSDHGSTPPLPSPPPMPGSQGYTPASMFSASLLHSKSHGNLSYGSPNQTSHAMLKKKSASATHQNPPTSNADSAYLYPSPTDLSPTENDTSFYAQQQRGHQRQHSGPHSPQHPYSSSSASLRKASGLHIGAAGAGDQQHRRHDVSEDDETCPVCLESLSIRLAGEKPHIVPVCGHKLHAECFETAYGANEEKVPENLMGSVRRPGTRKKPLGICGICRSELKISEDGGGRDKFAAISGQPGRSPSSPVLDTHKVHSISKRTIGNDDTSFASLHDPSEDQDIVNPHQLLPAYMQHLALSQSRSDLPSSDPVRIMRVQPKITVRAEHQSISRLLDPEKKVHLTCMVTVEIPSRVLPNVDHQARNVHLPMHQPQHQASHSQSTILPASASTFSVGSSPGFPNAKHNSTGTESSAVSVPRNPSVGGVVDERRPSTARTDALSEDFPTSPSVSAFSQTPGNRSVSRSVSSTASAIGMEKNASGTSNMGIASSLLAPTASSSGTAETTPGSVSASSFPGPSLADAHFAAHNASNATLTAVAQQEKEREAHGPFAGVFEDLQKRMLDWKGHEPALFGSLRMYDYLSVKKDKNVREFLVYLFEEALLCVVDDRRKEDRHKKAKEYEKVRLKGRVFVKHMIQVEETSASGELSLTIHMEDDSLEHFVILFPNRPTLDTWRSQIQALIEHHRPPLQQPQRKSSMAPSTSSTGRRDSVLSGSTSRSGQSAASRYTRATTAPSINGSSKVMPEGAIPPIPEAPSGALPSTPNSGQQVAKRPSMLETALQTWTPPDSATWLPIDLMLVFSLPPAHSNGPSSSALKLRLIKSTLEFVIRAVGPRARISVVTYTVGDTIAYGQLRKTPWLATGRSDGMARLEQVCQEIMNASSSPTLGSRSDHEGLVNVDAKEEKITVASAVNLALDILLQRTAKSAFTGMILLNDGKDGAQKQQIDVVMARADASKVPIHTFGWGRAHDPSSLWLLSNHTKGTYTFVRDYYQLKDAVAGCVGGMISVAVASMKLHLNVQERRWFKIRKVAGVGNAIVSSDGKDVDIELGELRHGEKKEMLVEIEMASPRSATLASPRRGGASSLGRKSSMTATDSFFRDAGVDPHAFSDVEGGDFFDEIEDKMAQDVPVFEVNASFRNPLDETKTVARLPYPILLTTTVNPPAAETRSPGSPAPTVSDPTIVRRRMELLTSDMMTRTLLLMSRRQDAHASRLLTETTRIFTAVMENLNPAALTPSSSTGQSDDSKMSADLRYANDVLLACLEDVEHMRAGCADREEFDHMTRNYGAQQAVALRDQRAWTSRTATEALFFCKEWTAIFGKALNTPNF